MNDNFEKIKNSTININSNGYIEEHLKQNQTESIIKKKYSCSKIQKISNLMRDVLQIANPNAEEEIICKTPLRYAEALSEMTKGYSQNVEEMITEAIFSSNGYNEIIIVKDINFSSLCEHHMMPFFGQASIGYIPEDKILGLSKFPRLVETLSKKMQLQERLTKEIADTLDKYLQAKGVIVFMEAIHSCMCFRGIKSFGAKTQTVYTTGEMKTKENFDKFFTMSKNNV